MRKTKTPAGTTSIRTKKVVKRVELPPNPFIHEILDHVEEQKTKAKKIAALKKYRDDSLTAILIWNFDDSVISAVPEGQVPYKENEVPIVINPDAHSAEGLSDLSYGVDIARKGWLCAEDVLNTRSGDELDEILGA